MCFNSLIRLLCCAYKKKSLASTFAPVTFQQQNSAHANKTSFSNVQSYVRSPSVEINGRGPTKRINFCNEPHIKKRGKLGVEKKLIRVDCIVQQRPCNKTTLTLTPKQPPNVAANDNFAPRLNTSNSFSLSLIKQLFCIEMNKLAPGPLKKRELFIRDTLRGILFVVESTLKYTHCACRSNPSSKISHFTLAHSRVKNAKKSLSLGQRNKPVKLVSHVSNSHTKT